MTVKAGRIKVRTGMMVRARMMKVKGLMRVRAGIMRVRAGIIRVRTGKRIIAGLGISACKVRVLAGKGRIIKCG